MRRALPLLLWLLGEATVVVALHRLGRVPGLSIPFDDIPRWLRTGNPEDAIAATLRIVALACAWWQLAVTAVYCLARAARAPRAMYALGRAMLPVVRRSVDRAVAVSLVAGSAFASATSVSAAPADPPTVDVRTGRAVAPPTSVPPDPPAPAVPAALPTDPASDPRVHVALAGDNLWTIAAAHVAASTGRAMATLSDGEIAPYWARVCDANRARVRSGDVDLIYPGEAILLPPV